MQNYPQTNREWHWRVLNLSWPIVLSTLSIPLVGLVDTIVLGRLDSPIYMAAVSIAVVIFSSVFWAFGFLRMGTTGFVAQAHGAGNKQGVVDALLRALSISVVLGFVIISLQIPIISLAFSLMGSLGDAGSDSLMPLVQEYFSIRIWSAPATFINYSLLGCLIGLQKMRTALMLQLVLNLSNIILDVILVVYMGEKSAGVAWASVASEYLAAFAGLWILRRLISLPASWSDLFNTAALKKLLAVNGDLFLRTLFLTSAFFFFTAQSTQMGVVIVAANGILINLLQTIAYGLDGFAHAAEALSGSAYGAKNKLIFNKAVKITTLWAFITALGFSLFYALFGDAIIHFMTSISAVAETAKQYYLWIIIAPVVAVWSYQMDGVYIGATQTKIMRNTVGFALLVYISLVLILLPDGGNHTLWACLILFLLLRGVGLIFYYPKVLDHFN
ncbi:MAG: MATE family efflux transporter [Aquificaceae bacterium]|nr:MAG: MATE family efflux transporter [Aquificaceae bacterium]